MGKIRKVDNLPISFFKKRNLKVVFSCLNLGVTSPNIVHDGKLASENRQKGGFLVKSMGGT